MRYQGSGSAAAMPGSGTAVSAAQKLVAVLTN
jgi:hypothetical protein